MGERDSEARALVNTLRREGLRDEAVLRAIQEVPRHRFVPNRFQAHAWLNRPLPIGQRQTISQPHVVARMTELVEPRPTDRALEIGTGSAYQAAVLARLVDHVYSVEVLPELATNATRLLGELGIGNVTVRCADGYEGWPEQAPFDIVIVTAAPEAIPPPLIEQLAPGGRLIIPVGPHDEVQTLTLVQKDSAGRLHTTDELLVKFVPMTGRAQREEA